MSCGEVMRVGAGVTTVAALEIGVVAGVIAGTVTANPAIGLAAGLVAAGIVVAIAIGIALVCVCVGLDIPGLLRASQQAFQCKSDPFWIPLRDACKLECD